MDSSRFVAPHESGVAGREDGTFLKDDLLKAIGIAGSRPVISV